MIKSLVMPAFNKDLASQARYLEVTLLKCKTVREVLERIPELGLPDWHIGVGAVAQTVWNELHGFPPDTGIRDCDVVYFDPDTSFEAEDKVIQAGSRLFASLTVDVEIRNEARVHLWYEQKFGKKITPYNSTEDAINSWPTTATAIGVRYNRIGQLLIYALYGLNDLLGMIVRPNKGQITPDIYQRKAERWQKVWPRLQVVPWDQ